MKLCTKLLFFPVVVILGVAVGVSRLNAAVPRLSTLLTAVTSSFPLTLVSSQPTESSGSHKQVVDEVWQIVERQYIDTTFNGQDWKTVRQQYLNRDYASTEEAYKAVKEMLEQLGDPLTRFMTPAEFKSIQVDSSNPKITGIGLQLSQDKKTKELVVITPLEDTPAFKAGILAKDVLLKIDGQSTQEMNVNEAVARLRGQVGTPVVLLVRRGQKELEFRITRTPIEIRPVSYRRQKIGKGEIGYIRFTQFSVNAATEMRQAIEDLEKQQVAGYVLDLRSNPGGLLLSSIEIAQMWLDNGTIVSTIDRQGQKDIEQAKYTALTNKPLVVLVNDGSASASEILAGALQDNQRATLVGTRTNGNNLIQSVRSLQDGSGLAVTVAKWVTPKGRDINKSGLQPDVVVSLTTAQQEALSGRAVGTPADPQYAKALTVLSQLLADR
jgi:carboxyl-terminal processing protease